jgi:hypothetical protein
MDCTNVNLAPDTDMPDNIFNEQQNRTYSKYADLPQLRTWRAHAQLDIGGVLELWESKSALPVLF